MRFDKLNNILFGTKKKEHPELPQVPSAGKEQGNTGVPMTKIEVHNVGGKSSEEVTELDPVLQAMNSIKEGDKEETALGTQETKVGIPPHNNLSEVDGPPSIDMAHPSTNGTVFAKKEETTVPKTPQVPTMSDRVVDKGTPQIKSLIEKYSAPLNESSKKIQSQSDGGVEKSSIEKTPHIEGGISSRPLQEMITKANENKENTMKQHHDVSIKADTDDVPTIEPITPELGAIEDVLADLSNMETKDEKDNREDTVSNIGVEITNETPVVEPKPIVNVIEKNIELPERRVGVEPSKQENTPKQDTENGITNTKQGESMDTLPESPLIKETKKESNEGLTVEKTMEGGGGRLAELNLISGKISAILREEGDANLRPAIKRLNDEIELRVALLKIPANTSKKTTVDVDGKEPPKTPKTPKIPENSNKTDRKEDFGDRTMLDAKALSQAIRKVAIRTKEDFGIIGKEFGDIPNAQEKVERLLAA